MKASRWLLLLSLVLGLGLGAGAQQSDRGSNAIININVSRTIETVNYWARGSTKVDFNGTALLPRASGKADVSAKNGSIMIDAQFDGLSAPSTFGPAYLVYVLWGITPEGHTTNLGQLPLKDGKAKLQVTTKLQTFGMIVTAEPYFAVAFPSEDVILANAIRSDTRGAVTPVNAQFELLQRGKYSTANLPALPDDGAPLDLQQARNAINVAKWQGADKYAADSLAKAQASLDQAEDYFKRKQKNSVPTVARQAVQAAEDARAIAVKRQADEKVAQDQAAADAAAAKAKQEADEEAAARAQADAQRAHAEQQKAAADAAAAASAAQAQQEAAARAQADQQRAAADAAAAKAEQEKQELRAKLLEQFNRVLPTTDTPRGLVVNMGDVLFDTAKADLRQNAREALAKLSGIVLNYPSLQLTIEGHTDSTGTEAFNQTLSEKRADNVRDYLVAQGLPATSISAQGLGESSPVADNSTAAGRQKNRRVEIVVSGEVIGSKIGQ